MEAGKGVNEIILFNFKNVLMLINKIEKRELDYFGVFV